MLVWGFRVNGMLLKIMKSHCLKCTFCFENRKTFGTMQKDSQNSQVTIQYMHTQKNNVSEERRLYF
jgi:hypothetical protein